MKNIIKTLCVFFALLVITATLISCTNGNANEEGSLGENPFMNSENDQETVGVSQENGSEGNTDQYGLPIVPID